MHTEFTLAAESARAKLESAEQGRLYERRHGEYDTIMSKGSIDLWRFQGT